MKPLEIEARSILYKSLNYLMNDEGVDKEELKHEINWLLDQLEEVSV